MDKDRKYFLTWLIVIVAIGCALRVFRLNEIPFTFDELSALYRTHFTNLHDLIKLGVAGDGHPAGVQVFLFYWTKLVGETEWLVKLPFIITSILCIPLIYRIGARWFSRDAGIIAACLMAGLQYPVMYSQIARPYITGLFLVLLLVVIWNELVEQVTLKRLMAFAVVLALCAYNHYFSLLTAACIVATGFFVIDRKQLPKYILSIVFAAVLFLPHMHLFLGHLKLKGLEWLGPPTRSFLPDYLYYVFNFSNYILIALALLIGQGIYIGGRKLNGTKMKYRIIALLWFFIPLVTGYLYSKYRAPVLQNSVLIFSFPFLVLFVCSFVTLPYSRLRDLEIAALLLVLVLSLGWERSYYKTFYHAEIEMFARHISGYENAYGPTQVRAVVNTNPNYLSYYKRKYDGNWSFQTFDSIGDNVAWRKWLAKCNADYLILCNPPQEWGNQNLAIAKEYFPCTDSVYSGFTTDIFVLRRGITSCKLAQPLFTYTLNDSTGVRVKEKLRPYATVDGEAVYSTCDSLNKRGSLFFSSIRAMAIDETVKIDLSLEVYADSLTRDDALVMQFKDSRGRVMQERRSVLQSFAAADTGWVKVYLTARLYHSPVNKTAFILVDLKSGANTCLKFKNFRLEAVKDNPILYSLVKK